MKGKEQGRKKNPCSGREEKLGCCLCSSIAWSAGCAKVRVEKTLWRKEEDCCLLPHGERYLLLS